MRLATALVGFRFGALISGQKESFLMVSWQGSSWGCRVGVEGAFPCSLQSGSLKDHLS